MLYSFPVSPSVLFGAPCRVVITRHGILHCVWKNKKKASVYRLSCEKSQKNEDNNKLPYCGTPRKASRLPFWVFCDAFSECLSFGMPQWQCIMGCHGGSVCLAWKILNILKG